MTTPLRWFFFGGSGAGLVSQLCRREIAQEFADCLGFYVGNILLRHPELQYTTTICSTNLFTEFQLLPLYILYMYMSKLKHTAAHSLVLSQSLCQMSMLF